MISDNIKSSMNLILFTLFKLVNVSRSTGLQLAQQPTDTQTISDRDSRREVEKIKNYMERISKENRIKILFVVIPDSGPTYSSIKKTAELQCGVLTQCIKGGTVFRKRTDTSTISNILLKVNAKLNGTNHRLNSPTIDILSKQKCMFIGADVTHPSPDQSRIPR